MQEIPNRIIKLIEREQLDCKNCNNRFSVNNLVSISIQESSKSPHKDYLCIGLLCSNCEELVIFELKEMTLSDFAFDILDQQTSKNIKKKSEDATPALLYESTDRKSTKRAKKKSKIAKKEVDDIKDFLKNKDLKYDEFLIALGILPEDIDKYNYKK